MREVNEVDSEIRLRRISSMDGSSTYESLSEKKEILKTGQHQKKNIKIPEYPKAKPYKNNRFKRLWARMRYFFALLRQKASGKDYPLISILVVNNNCNWNCTYCFGDYPNRRDIDYTTNEIKYMVDELYSQGCRYINMHGGETLLRNDIGELVNYIKGKGMYLGLITNGALFPKKIEEVRNVDSMTVSLDGAKESNDMCRGEGTFDVTLNAIRLAISEKIPLRVSATVTRHSMHDVGYLARLAQEENFHLYFSILFKPLKRAQAAQMSNDEIRFVLKEIEKYRSMGYPVFTSDRAIKAAYEWPYDYNDYHHCTEKEIPDTYRSAHVPCYYSRTKFTIEADGYVYPCFLTTDGSFKPKNWREVGMKEAIDYTRKANTCKACPAMSQNDHNALLDLNWKQVGYVMKDQVKEALRLRGKVRDPRTT